MRGHFLPLKEVIDGSGHQKLGPHPGKLDKNKEKNIKNLTRCRDIADQQKAWKQGIEMIATVQYVHNSTLHIFNVEGWGCILNYFMLSSLPCFHAFC